MLCPNCRRPMRDWLEMPLDAKKDAETPFRATVRCSACGLGAVHPSPRPDEVPALYSLSSYYTHGASHIRPVTARLLDRVLVRLAWQADRARPFDVEDIAARLPPGGTVLDLGCGDAETLELFAQKGFDVLGVDPDARSREQAAARGVTVLDGTAEAPPAALEGRRFDLVIMSHSLEHCLDPTAAVASVARLVAPGGLAYIEVPNAGCAHFRTFRQCSEMFDSPRHLWFFTPEALEAVAIGAGLRVGEWRFNGYTRHFKPSWRAWEREIHDRLRRRGWSGGAKRHTLLRSFGLLARTAFARAPRKYDSVGVLATVAPVRAA